MVNVVYTKPREERRAMEHLEQQNFECFLPLGVSKRGNVIQPLFPRYLFIWLTQDRSWAPITNTPGVSNILIGMDDLPGEVPDSVIYSIQDQMEAEGGAILIDADDREGGRFVEGQTILIVGGEHIGLEGLFVSKSGDRVTALLQMFGREVKTSVRLDNVR